MQIDIKMSIRIINRNKIGVDQALASSFWWPLTSLYPATPLLTFYDPPVSHIRQPYTHAYKALESGRWLLSPDQDGVTEKSGVKWREDSKGTIGPPRRELCHQELRISKEENAIACVWALSVRQNSHKDFLSFRQGSKFQELIITFTLSVSGLIIACNGEGRSEHLVNRRTALRIWPCARTRSLPPD